MSPADLRCPECSALVRAGTDWCTLCHADLRPADEVRGQGTVDELVARPLAIELDVESPVVDDVPGPGAPGEGGAGLEPTLEPLIEPARGKHARPAPPTDAVAEQMLAELRRQSTDPTLSRLGGRMTDPGTRLTVMVAGTLGLAVVLLAAYAVLGLIFG